MAVSACAKLEFLIVFMLFGLPFILNQLITGDLTFPNIRSIES